MNSSQLDRTQDIPRPSGPPLNRLLDSVNKSSHTPTINYETKPRFSDFHEKSQLQQDLSCNYFMFPVHSVK